MKKFIIQTIFLGLFMVFSQSSAVYAQSCQMPDGTHKEISCNVYLDQLYSACAAPDEIADAQSGKCVPIVVFKRPLMGCFEDQCDIATSYPGYSPLALTSDLASFKLEGYLNAETVVIFLQGGPDDRVADDYVQFLEEDALVANVLQTNVAKMGIVKASDMTVEDARLEQQENLRLIHTAYTAIRAQFPEKRIVLAGHSMGAFLTLGYLAEYGNNFDRVMAMAGRVDLPLDFVRRFAIGQNFLFDHVGDVSRYEETREVREVHKFSPYLRTAYSPNAESTLLAAVGLPRYS
ncbi:alpha/beta hydrolase [Planktomarina temperata]|uniref:alpha/beta hydrolase n=1 Tax=Planktomarina temperata TaxID=1284658 RepID=UPI003F6A3FE8